MLGVGQTKKQLRGCMIRGRRADPDDDDAADDITPTGAIDDDAAGMSDIFGARIPGIGVHVQAIMSGVPGMGKYAYWKK